MSIHKDNATGKWRVVYRYTDWTGETHQSSKRGFPTKREAQMWERELLLKKEAKLDMTFESFYEIYVEDMQNRIRDNTWGTKTNIARTKILPYFGKRKIGEIEPRDIIAWQNEWKHTFTRLFTALRGVIWRCLDMGSVLRCCGTASDSVRMRGAPEQAYLPGFAQL